MKLLKFSVVFISKFKGNYIISSCKKNPFFWCKSYASQITPSSFLSSSYRCFSITNPCKTDSLSSNNGKLFREIENEYAHQVMENVSAYSSSLLKYPFQNESCTFKSEEHPGHLNVFDRFVQSTLHNVSEGATVEDTKFTDLIEELCIALPKASDGNVKKILHYLCMWPPTSSCNSQNFQFLWKTLDQECVKRMKQWNAVKIILCQRCGDVHRGKCFHRKFSKMSEKNNHLVFVYGTLKRGEPNHDLIEKRTEGIATFHGIAKTVKKWPLIIASRYNIPYLLYSEGRGMHVIGEVYEVDDIVLAKLDELECHPEYYTRLVEEVHMISEKEEKLLKPWVYFLKNFRSELLELPCLSEYSSKGSHGLEYVSSDDTNNPEDIYT